MDLSRKIKKISILADNYYKFALLKLAATPGNATAEGIVTDIKLDVQSGKIIDKVRFAMFANAIIVELIRLNYQEIYDGSNLAKEQFKTFGKFKTEVDGNIRLLKTHLYKLASLYEGFLEDKKGGQIAYQEALFINNEFLYEDGEDPSTVEDLFQLPLLNPNLSETLKEFLDNLAESIQSTIVKNKIPPHFNRQMSEARGVQKRVDELNNLLESGQSLPIDEEVEHSEIAMEAETVGISVYEANKQEGVNDGRYEFNAGAKGITFTQDQIFEYEKKRSEEKDLEIEEKDPEIIKEYDKLLNILSNEKDGLLKKKMDFADAVAQIKSYTLPGTDESIPLTEDSYKIRYNKLMKPNSKGLNKYDEAQALKKAFEEHFEDIKKLDTMWRDIMITSAKRYEILKNISKIKLSRVKSKLEKSKIKYPYAKKGVIISPVEINPATANLEDLISFGGDYFAIACIEVSQLEKLSLSQERLYNNFNYKKELNKLLTYVQQLEENLEQERNDPKHKNKDKNEIKKIKKLEIKPNLENTIKNIIKKVVLAKQSRKILVSREQKEFKKYKHTEDEGLKVIRDLDLAGQEIITYFNKSFTYNTKLHIANRLAAEQLKNKNSPISLLLSELYSFLNTDQSALSLATKKMEDVTNRKNKYINNQAYIFGLDTMTETKYTRIKNEINKGILKGKGFDYSGISKEKIEEIDSVLESFYKEYTKAKNSKRTISDQDIRNAVNAKLSEALNADENLKKIHGIIKSTSESVSVIQRIIQLNLSETLQVPKSEQKYFFEDNTQNPSKSYNISERTSKQKEIQHRYEVERDENINRIIVLYTKAQDKLKQNNSVLTSDQIMFFTAEKGQPNILTCQKIISQYIELLEEVKQDLHERYGMARMEYQGPKEEESTKIIEDDYEPQNIDDLDFLNDPKLNEREDIEV